MQVDSYNAGLNLSSENSPRRLPYGSAVPASAPDAVPFHAGFNAVDRPFPVDKPTPVAIKSGSRDDNRRNLASTAPGAWDPEAKASWDADEPPPVIVAALEAAEAAATAKQRSILQMATFAAM